MFAKFLTAALPLLMGASQQPPPPATVPMPPATQAHPWTEACENWDEWEKPGPPFKVYGNTYYVGTCGIGAILIVSDSGHTLIDSGTEAGAAIVLDNIRALGFRPQDVKLLLNSHEHFDHVGGMAIIQEATGASLVSSLIGLEVMQSGVVHRDDPQSSTHPTMRPVSGGTPYFTGEGQFLLQQFGIWPIATPGHSPGAMSWKWRACEADTCRTVVYADSLSAVSSDGYRFTDHPEYVAAFQQGLQRLEDIDCRILLTPHPSASSMREKLNGRDLAFQFDQPCRNYARAQSGKLRLRLQTETIAP